MYTLPLISYMYNAYICLSTLSLSIYICIDGGKSKPVMFEYVAKISPYDLNDPTMGIPIGTPLLSR